MDRIHPRRSTCGPVSADAQPIVESWRRAKLTCLSLHLSTSTFADRFKHFPHIRTQFLASLQGWRATINAGAVVAVSVLIINISLLIWASSATEWDSSTNTHTIKKADCDATQTFFTYLHLVINALSTLLLGTSNAAMQCLNAPTREAIERAHSNGKWLDIGISGFRNWPYMDKWRKWCWSLLLVSTVPLHLLYNSTIFSTTSANEYYSLIVPSNYQSIYEAYSYEDVSVTPNYPNSSATSGVYMDLQTLYDMMDLANATALTKKSPSECIGIYNHQVMTSYSNVLVVMNETTSYDLLLLKSFRSYPTPPQQEQSKSEVDAANSASDLAATSWLCGDAKFNCSADWLLTHPSSWNFTSGAGWNFTSGADVSFVDYCLLQDTTPTCTVQLVPGIMIIVIICNIVKILCFVAATRVRNFQPLITLGDALSSFLSRPDPKTANLGPLSAGSIRDAEGRARIRSLLKQQNYSTDNSVEKGEPKGINPMNSLPLEFGTWSGRTNCWFKGASFTRWSLTYALMCSLWAIGWVLFSIAMTSEHDSFAVQSSNGLGNVTPNSLISFSASLGTFANILIANVFQLLVSLAYISFNGLLTCILLSLEFTKYAHHRKGLRVSEPEGGAQRSSYWLSLPYRFSVPLLVCSGFLHWSVSQSIFLAEINVKDPLGNLDPNFSVSCLGFSTLGLLITMLIAFLIIISPLCFGWIQYPTGAPLVESNSIAISAACHPSPYSPGEALQPVMYGVLYGLDKECTALTNEPVTPLKIGQRYTCRNQLDSQILRELSPTMIPLSKRRKIWEPALALLHAAKLVSLVFYIVVFVSPDQLAQSDFWLYFGKQPSALGFQYLAGFSMTITYEIIRIIVTLLRRYRKRHLHHFFWHIAPEGILNLYWLIVLGMSVSAGPPNGNEVWSFVWNGGYESRLSPYVTWPVAISAGLTLAFFLSTAIELWLWCEQRRTLGLLPTWIHHPVKKSKKLARFRPRSAS